MSMKSHNPHGTIRLPSKNNQAEWTSAVMLGIIVTECVFLDPFISVNLLTLLKQSHNVLLNVQKHVQFVAALICVAMAIRVAVKSDSDV